MYIKEIILYWKKNVGKIGKRMKFFFSDEKKKMEIEKFIQVLGIVMVRDFTAVKGARNGGNWKGP